MSQTTTDAPVTIVIFGASGDLTQRKLVPALHTLACEDQLPPDTRVIGIARTPLSTEAFHDRLYDGVLAYARRQPDVCQRWAQFAGHYTYLAGDYEDVELYRHLTTQLPQPGNVLFYLATPPEVYPLIIEQLGKAGLNHSDQGWRRIIIEKPFGHSLESARQLNQQIHAVFAEHQVYRIDHYLGKETVQNLLTFRFANAIFEPVWNRNYVAHIQITMAESVGIEHRAGYYDRAGVLRDMFQNHMLQLLTLTAMEPPAIFEANALRDEKVKVLRAIRPITWSVRAQYQGYCNEPGVKTGSQTPTYAALQLFIDNWRWRDVPFYLRSGKRLAAKSTQIAIQFKDVPHLMFPIPPDQRIAPNLLSICIQPDEGFHLRFEAKQPGAGMSPRPVDMGFHYTDVFDTSDLPDAYERLLLDALLGDAALFARADEIELAWGVIDPLLARWEQPDAPPLFSYTPGSWGPPEAERLLAETGWRWIEVCSEHQPA